MAVRTTTAQALDSAEASYLTAVDNYIAQSNQTGEAKNVPAKIALASLISKLVSRPEFEMLLSRAQPLGMRGLTPAAPTNTVEARDPMA